MTTWEKVAYCAVAVLLAVIVVALWLTLSGCGWLAGRDPAAAAYAAERLRCVEQHDAAAPAKACMNAVDARYRSIAPEGGIP